MTKLEQAAYDEALRLCASAQKQTARDKRTIARLRREMAQAKADERARIVGLLRNEADSNWDDDDIGYRALKFAAEWLEEGGAWA